MVFSLNFLKLYRFDKDLRIPFNSEGLESRFELEQDGTFSVLAPAYSIDITKSLSLGITLNIWNDSVTQASHYNQKSVFTGIFVDASGNPTGEFIFQGENELEVEGGHSWVIGAIYRLNKALTLGVVIKPSFALDLDHREKKIQFQSGP